MRAPSKRALLLFLSVCVLAVVVSTRRAVAQDEKKEEPAAEAAPAAPAPIDPKAFPPYFTATSPDPDKPLWPDPTGAAAGYWTTPSPGPVGDGDPKTKTVPDLYDRIVHNLYSINFVW